MNSTDSNNNSNSDWFFATTFNQFLNSFKKEEKDTKIQIQKENIIEPEYFINLFDINGICLYDGSLIDFYKSFPSFLYKYYKTDTRVKDEFDKLIESKIIDLSVGSYYDNIDPKYFKIKEVYKIRINYLLEPEIIKRIIFSEEENNMNSENNKITLGTFLDTYKGNDILDIIDKNDENIYRGYIKDLKRIINQTNINILELYIDSIFMNNIGIFTIKLDYINKEKEDRSKMINDISINIINEIENFLYTFGIDILPEKDDPDRLTDPGEDLAIIYGKNYDKLKDDMIAYFEKFYKKKDSIIENYEYQITFGNIYNSLYYLYLEYILNPEENRSDVIDLDMAFEYYNQVSEKISNLAYRISDVLKRFGIIVN